MRYCVAQYGVRLVGLTHEMSWGMPCAVVQSTERQFSHIFVNHSFTVFCRKQLLLFDNSYIVPLPSSQCHCVLAFQY